MNYTSILKRAAQITWRHRGLWLFGILLALFGGSSAGGGGSSPGQFLGQGLQLRSDLPGFGFAPQDGIWLIVAAIMAVVLVLVLLVLSIVVCNLSIGALIGMVDEVERIGTTTVRSGLRIGWSRLLHLFLISLVIGIPLAIVVIGLLLVALAPPVALIILGATQEMVPLIVLGTIALIGLFLLWLLITIVLTAVVGVVSELIYRRAVLEGEGVFEAIGEGCGMVRRNLREAGLTWLILFGVNLALGIVAAPLLLLGMGLVVVPGLLLGAITQSIAGGVVAALPFLLILGAASLFLQGIYLVFVSAVWTLTYRQIAYDQGPGATPATEETEPPQPEQGDQQ